MGCDIHLILEAQTTDGRWVAVQSTSVLSRHDTRAFDLDAYYAHPLRRAKMRDYHLFSILSDVRSDHYREDDILMSPDIPHDASSWSVSEFGGDTDIHSIGWSTLETIQDALTDIDDEEERQLVENWLEELKLAAAQTLAEKMFLVEADLSYDEYGLSNHELLLLRTRLEQERAAAREEFEGLMPGADDLGRLRVIVGYDN